MSKILKVMGDDGSPYLMAAGTSVGPCGTALSIDEVEYTIDLEHGVLNYTIHNPSSRTLYLMDIGALYITYIHRCFSRREQWYRKHNIHKVKTFYHPLWERCDLLAMASVADITGTLALPSAVDCQWMHGVERSQRWYCRKNQTNQVTTNFYFKLILGMGSGTAFRGYKVSAPFTLTYTYTMEMEE